MLNVELLLDTLRKITIYPELWDQSVWGKKKPADDEANPGACGTAYCIAGHVAVDTGHDLLWTERQIWDYDKHKYVTVGMLAETTVDGEEIFDVGQRELGLTWFQADRLFDGDNSLEDLWELAENLTLGEISREWDYRDALRERERIERIRALGLEKEIVTQ